ncbi:olfactory receptor 6C1-like [Dromiciops gliroides]|uniref:olfactory receptor 6C1-like n=1 Tax=Dromiciops gliroides TaxID=33562 RepID=UPI001CC3879C|nr:olfactory receptor 6C1-like [Dromiciops gliroides]
MTISLCDPLLPSPGQWIQIKKRKAVVGRLVFCSWFMALMMIFPAILPMQELGYYVAVIDHFICDYSPLLQLSCTDRQFLETMGISWAIIILMLTLALIIHSYTYIIQTILCFPSVSQRKKTFYTCSSHLIVISIFYGNCIFMYIKPSAKERASLSKGGAMLNTSVTPMLNPFIYSLRNQQVKQAFMDMICKIIFSLNKRKH